MDITLDIDGNQFDRASAYYLAALLMLSKDPVQLARGQEIDNRLREIREAEQSGHRALPGPGPGVGMRWTVTSLANVASLEMAQMISDVFARVTHELPELMAVTVPGMSSMIVAAEALPEGVRDLNSIASEIVDDAVNP